MQQSEAIFQQVWPYQQDQLGLPVQNLESALPFYQDCLGFQLVSRTDTPQAAAILARDSIQIGLAENGGDPAQDGCFFEVDDLDKALAELRQKGLTNELSGVSQQRHGTVDWRVFFVVAPDGLCFCYGQRQS